jgi:hypothetical protein
MRMANMRFAAEWKHREQEQAPNIGSALQHIFLTWIGFPSQYGPCLARMIRRLVRLNLVGNIHGLAARHARHLKSYRTKPCAVPRGNNRMAMSAIEAAMEDCGYRLHDDQLLHNN